MVTRGSISQGVTSETERTLRTMPTNSSFTPLRKDFSVFCVGGLVVVVKNVVVDVLAHARTHTSPTIRTSSAGRLSQGDKMKSTR